MQRHTCEDRPRHHLSVANQVLVPCLAHKRLSVTRDELDALGHRVVGTCCGSDCEVQPLCCVVSLFCWLVCQPIL